MDERDLRRRRQGEPAAAMYGIRFIPSNFLIAPDGTIAAKNVSGRLLQERLEKLMK